MTPDPARRKRIIFRIQVGVVIFCFTVTGVIALVSLVMYSRSYPGVGLPPRDSAIFFLSATALMLVTVIVSLILERRKRRNRASGTLCEKCSYPIDDIVGVHCPECGHDNTWRKMT